MPLIAQESIDMVGEVARDAGQERPVRVGRHASDLDGARGEVDRKQHVVRDEAVRGPGLDGQRHSDGVCADGSA